MRTQLLKEYYEGADYREKLFQRMNTLKRCEEEPTEIMRLALSSWSVDPISFIEQFGFLINPKYYNEIKPFFLFDYQKEILIKIWEAENSGEDVELLIDKPREMGLTWVLIWYQIWRFLFTKNWSGFNLSRTEAEVDDGTADPTSSIFGKFRWSLGMLPEWMIPEGYVPKGKKGNPTDMKLRLSNPQLGSTLVGSTTNENAGRSRRYSFIFVDECFFIERFQTVHRALTSVSNMKVYVSTSKVGRVYKGFVDLCQERGHYVTLKYSDNPFKDDQWREEKMREAEYDPEALKEIEVGYNVNIDSQYYPEINQSQVSESVKYNPNIPLYVSLDYGRQDHTVSIWWQFDGLNINIVECVAKNRVDFDWFVPFLNREREYTPDKYFGHYKTILEKIRTWKKPLAYFGEPAHKQVHYPSNTSIMKELAKYGIMLRVNDNAIRHEVRRRATCMLLPRCVFNSSSEGVMELYDAISNSRYAGSVKGVSKEAAMKPAHDDEVGDYRAAFENGCVNFPRILRGQREDINPQWKQGNFIGNMVKYLKI